MRGAPPQRDSAFGESVEHRAERVARPGTIRAEEGLASQRQKSGDRKADPLTSRGSSLIRHRHRRPRCVGQLDEATDRRERVPAVGENVRRHGVFCR